MTVNYELTFITDKEDPAVLKETEELITGSAGRVNDKKDWGKRDFSYLIKGKNSGYYFIWQIELDGARVKDFKTRLNLNSKIMRYLLLKKDK